MGASQCAGHRVQLFGRQRGPVRAAGRALPTGHRSRATACLIARWTHDLEVARASRRVDQPGQDALAGQELVHRVRPLGIIQHHLVVEAAIQHQLRVDGQVEALGRVLQKVAQAVRPQRQRLRVVGRAAGEHAEPLAQHHDLRIAALLVPARDFAQHDLLVHHRVLDQGQRLVVQLGLRLLARRPRAADARQRRLQREHVVRHQVAAVLLQRAEVHEDLRLRIVAAGLLGLLEQLLLELHQHAVQRRHEIRGDMVQQVLQYAPHARRQGRRCDRGRRGSGRRRSCRGHRCSGLPCSRIIITPCVACAPLPRRACGPVRIRAPGTVRSHRW